MTGGLLTLLDSDVTPDKAGEIKSKGSSLDIGGNTSEKEITITVVDDRDTTPPGHEITSPNSGSGLDLIYE